MVSNFYKDRTYLGYLLIDHFDRLHYFPLKFKFPTPCEFLKAQRLIAVNDNNNNNNNNKNLAQFSTPP